MSQRGQVSGIVFATIMSLSIFTESGARCFRKGSETPSRRALSCYKSSAYESELAQFADGNFTDFALIYSNVPTLKNDAFQDMTQLQTIVVFQCGVRNVDDNAFAGVTELESLTLSNNLLETIKAVWFERIPKLRSLIVKRNRILRIEPTTAIHWTNLQYLDISENKLQCLPLNFMEQLSGLRYINCRENPWWYKCCYDIMEWALLRGQLIIKPQYENVQDIHNVTRDCIRDLTTSDNLSVDMCVENKLDGMIRRRIVRSDFL